MAKSVYSLVLSDDIVAAIDAMAARQGFSRSALINRILAEYASVKTPEARLRHVADAAGQAAQESFHAVISAGGTLTLRTALRYRYNPTVSYVVVLQDAPDRVGELRVEVRTGSADLQDWLQAFWQVWNNLEASYLPKAPAPGQHAESEKRYVRQLRQAGLHGEELGEAIAAYVTAFDASMKAFLEASQNAGFAAKAAEEAYKQALKTMGLAKKF